MMAGYRERVAQAFADRLKTCTPANGCSFTANVVRRKLGEQVSYVGGTVEVVTGPMERSDALEDQHGWTVYTFPMGITVIAPADETSSEPVETTVDRCVCDVHRILAIADGFGLCDDITLQSIDDFDQAPGEFAGADLTYLCVIQVLAADLAHGRTDP